MWGQGKFTPDFINFKHKDAALLGKHAPIVLR